MQTRQLDFNERRTYLVKTIVHANCHGGGVKRLREVGESASKIMIARLILASARTYTIGCISSYADIVVNRLPASSTSAYL